MKAIDKTQRYWLQTLFLDEGDEYTIVKDDGTTTSKIHTFSSSSDIQGELLDIIANCFPYMFSVLNMKIEYALHTNVENMPHFHFELYAKISEKFYLVSIIGDIENINIKENSAILRYPGAMEYIKKSITYISDKTKKAFS
ncbi:hypothetical protein [Chitinophaga sp.]|uniref:hypothetical protein n=1 Tax=Chitinophaga sp. TaxID=1869181 RepID=UPI002F94FB21